MRNAYPNALPIYPWVAYQLRSTTTTEMSGARSAIGWLALDLNHLAIALSMATVDAINFALAYERAVKEHLEEEERARA